MYCWLSVFNIITGSPKSWNSLDLISWWSEMKAANPQNTPQRKGLLEPMSARVKPRSNSQKHKSRFCLLVSFAILFYFSFIQPNITKLGQFLPWSNMNISALYFHRRQNGWAEYWEVDKQLKGNANILCQYDCVLFISSLVDFGTCFLFFAK